MAPTPAMAKIRILQLFGRMNLAGPTSEVCMASGFSCAFLFAVMNLSPAGRLSDTRGLLFAAASPSSRGCAGLKG